MTKTRTDFKVGDKVRAFSGGAIYEGTVVKVTSLAMLVDTGSEYALLRVGQIRSVEKI